MKSMIKKAVARTPYRIVRRGHANRFAAIEDTLKSLGKRGFTPSNIIDAGANVGAFASFVLDLFPESLVHAIEPQPGCKMALDVLREQSPGRLSIHSVALGTPEQDGKDLQLASDATSTSTGAHVILQEDVTVGIKVPCVTLDRLMEGVLERDEGALLKLDLQGYELQALLGGMATLARCDVVLTEVSFYAQAYEPSISELVTFMAGQGFELYDIASLFARPRDDRPRQGDFIFLRRDCALAVDRSWS